MLTFALDEHTLSPSCLLGALPNARLTQPDSMEASLTIYSYLCLEFGRQPDAVHTDDTSKTENFPEKLEFNCVLQTFDTEEKGTRVPFLSFSRSVELTSVESCSWVSHFPLGLKTQPLFH